MTEPLVRMGQWLVDRGAKIRNFKTAMLIRPKDTQRRIKPNLTLKNVLFSLLKNSYR